MLFTKNQAQILAILLNHPEKDFNLSEIGEIIKKHPGVFQKGINSLEKQGIIVSKKKRNQKFLKINNDNPFFDEIKSIVEKTVGIEEILRKLICDIDGITLALIYGSYAKGEMRSDSDVDILVITRNEESEDILLDRIITAEKKILRDINYKVYTEDEFALKREGDDPFLKEVLFDKYILIKGELL